MNGPGKYTHSKYFIIGLVVLFILSAFCYYSASPDNGAGWNLFYLVPSLFAVMFYWPIDYLVYRRTMKQLRGKPTTIDPNFKLKRNILIAVIIFGLVAIYLINTFKAIMQSS